MQFNLHLFYEENHVIRLCRLTNKGTLQLHMFNLYRGLFDLLIQGTNVYLAFNSGDIEFFEVVSLIFDVDLRKKLE